MVDETNAAPAAPADFTPTVPENTGPFKATDAAKLISEAREKAFKASQQPEARQKPRDPGNGRFAAAQESTPTGEDAAPPQEATGETTDADPADVPLLERPRSWAKDHGERWNSLDRATQEFLLEQDRTSSDAVRKAQNDAAEHRKAIEAERESVKTAKAQYEQAAQRHLAALQSQVATEFGDIKTIADVQKLAGEDPFRFAQFQARQMQLQAQAQEVDGLQKQAADERRTTFDAWSKEQDTKFEKQFPEFADKEKAPERRKMITGYLTQEVGVPENALSGLWGNELFRDAMMQRVIYDAARFHAAQQKAKAAVAVPKPAPQRPGAAPEKGSSAQEAVTAAQQRLNGARGINAARAAADLISAKRAAAPRR